MDEAPSTALGNRPSKINRGSRLIGLHIDSSSSVGSTVLEVVESKIKVLEDSLTDETLLLVHRLPSSGVVKWQKGQGCSLRFLS